MTRLLALLFLFCLLVFVDAFGQRSEKYESEYAPFYRAEELFQKEQFSAAKKIFREFIISFNDKHDPQFVKARYYEGLSALHLYNNDAIQLLTEFNNDYPENIYKNDIYFKIGQHFYQRKKYSDANDWFERTNVKDIDTSEVAEYYFKLGYANFQLGEFSKARNSFFEVKDGTSSYAAPAMYYYSHIAYQNETYQVALEGFLSLMDNPSFKNEVSYYITQIYYLQGQFDKVVEFAPAIIDSIPKSNTAEMNQLIGDAYYKIGRFDEAVNYLEEYSNNSNTSREDDYQLGYAYFMSTYYKKAVRQFDKVSRKKDKLGQVALYHAAESYLKLDELNNARAAFEAASKIEIDAGIQEDALYNYAVLSYELDYNPYNDAIRAFELFLENFPNSKRKEDVYEYLVNVYTSTKKYEEALASLDRIEKKDIKLKSAYQVISFNLGIEEYERGNFKNAINALEKVKTYSVDHRLEGKAVFWQADAYYNLKDYKNAIAKFREFLKIPGNYESNLRELAYYNIAYCYYDQKDYIQAIESFRTFTKLPSANDKLRLADAYIRIGDAYYTKKDPSFESSALNYEKAVELKQANLDRALFYLAKVYGFLPDKRSEKITTLLDIVNNHRSSNYIVPSIFEIGLSYKYEGNLEKGFEYLNQILNDYPNNILVKEALIEIGDIKYKQKAYEESESYFNRVLNEYNLDDEKCKTATKGLQDIYRATRQQDKIAEIAQKYPCAEITDDDQEAFYYETANELYLNENYDEAIPEINKYLNVYPEGRFSIQLTSYLADIYYQRDEKGQALALYRRIIEKPTSAYTEEALVRASKTLYNDGEYADALPYYSRLEPLASSPQIIYNTRVGLMRCNYLLDFYANAAQAARKVLADELIRDDIRVEANYVAGMSLFKEEKYDEAITYLKWTSENTGAERGTEALHILAETNFELGNFEKAEKIHKELLKRKPAYDYWIARSLILQARVFMAMDDLFQAENTINLVLNNYPEEDDGILIEAQKFKSELMQLKDEPDKIEEDTNRVIDFQEGGDDE